MKCTIKYTNKKGKLVVRHYEYPSYYIKKMDKPGYIHPLRDPNARHIGKGRRKMIIERDKSCRVCGGTDNIDVHHIDKKGGHLTETPNNKPDNLIVLCHRCHIRLHCGINERNEDIVAMRKKGQSLSKIGNAYGISRQRVLQILQKYS